MKALGTVLVTGMMVMVPASTHGQTRPCSVGMLEGAWVFATGIGHLSAQPPIPEAVRGRDITAMGTINIDGRGNLSGTYDNVIADVGSSLRVTFVGTVTVNTNCTGTLAFTDSRGASRTDSIVVILRGEQSELWGMSRNHLLLWTYTAKRIAPLPN